MCSNCTSYADKLGKKPKQTEIGYRFQCKHPTSVDNIDSNLVPNPSISNHASMSKRIPKRPIQLPESYDVEVKKKRSPTAANTMKENLALLA
jgi:hypothetical protein